MLIGLLAVMLVLGLAGCKSASEKIGEEIGEAVVGGAVGADVEVDEDRVTIETDDGVATIAGGEGMLVAEFPDDFPLYKDADIETSTYFGASDGRDQVYVLLSTGDPVGDVYDWYKSELGQAGWEITQDAKMTTGDGEMAQLAAESDDREAALMINSDGGETQIVVNVYIGE
jgi:hypothetical protein